MLAPSCTSPCDSRLVDDVEDVVGDRRIDADGAGVRLQREDVGRSEDRLQLIDRLAAAVLREDGALGLAVRVADLHAEQEAVELAFGQRVGALELVRVLRGDDEERRAEPAGVAVHRHLPLAHRLEQCGLRARRGAVDLVGEHDLGEQRAGLEDELAGLLAVDGDADQVAGQQVGRELDAVELAGEAAGERLGQQRLADAGHVFEQEVPVGEEGDEREPDDLRLAEEHLRRRWSRGRRAVTASSFGDRGVTWNVLVANDR